MAEARAVDVPLMIYWAAMYGFCVAALVRLRIAAARPVYFLACILFAAGTLLLCTRTKTNHETR